MSSQTKVTTDLTEIQRFAEGCDAVPATVRDTMDGDEPGVLTLDVLGHGAGEESLEHIGWDAWYDKFNAAKLALLYQERKADGEPSTFFKLVDRDTASESEGAGDTREAGDADEARGSTDADAAAEVSDDEAAMGMAMSLPEPGETKATTVLAEIQRFAEGCDAVPATVRDTMDGDEPGVLTLDVLGHGAGEESLEHIGWDAWYDKFESQGLALLYQERKADGEPSTFFKLVDRDTPDEVDTGSSETGEEDAGGGGGDTPTSKTGDAAPPTGEEQAAQDDAPGGRARVRATIGASGATGGGTLRATFATSSEAGTSEAGEGDGGHAADRDEASGTDQAAGEGSSYEPPEPGETKATTVLAEIQRFAEGCDAVPATVRDTMDGDEPGVLTLDVLGHGAGEESLEHIGWDAWYDKFESQGLALLYQERKADGEPSTFFKLVDRDRAED